MNISLDSTKEEKLKTKSNVKDCESEKTIYERVFNGLWSRMKNDRNRSGKTRPFLFEGSQEMSCVGVPYLKSNFRIQ